MSKLYRNILQVFSLLFFAVLAPIMVLYALGYRLPKEGEVDNQVGVLIVESNPQGADVYLDGDYVGRTPESIANLRPGLVRVRVSEEGAEDWEKDIMIRAGAVTEVRNIRLFPDNKKVRTLAGGVDMFSLSPSRNLIAAVDFDNQLRLMDTEGVRILPPVDLGEEPKSLLWSPDSNYILVSLRDSSIVLDVTEVPVEVVDLTALKGAEHIAWDPRIPGRLQVVTRQDDLVAYNIATDAEEVIKSGVKNFAVSSRYIYVLDQDNEIEILDLQGNLITQSNIDVDKNIKQVQVTPGDNVVLLFEDNSLVYLDKDDELLEVADSVDKFGWSPDERILFLQLDNTSLYVMNMSDERLNCIPLREKRLVVRLSREIRNPQWYAGGRHLIYQVEDEIYVTEIDTRDNPESYKVDTTNLGDSHVTVGSHGNEVFYLKKTGKKNRLVISNLEVEEE